MNQEIDILYLSLFRADSDLSSTAISLAKEFQKSHRVFYVNHPFTYKDLLIRWRDPAVKMVRKNLLLRKTAFTTIPNLPNLVIVEPPPIIPTNWLPEGKLYSWLSTINRRIIYRTYRKVIHRYRMKRYLYLNCFNPFFGCVLSKRFFNPLLNIYQCVDEISEAPYLAKHGKRLEKQCIEQSDITFYTSVRLLKRNSDKNPNSYLLGNAVDHKIFQNAYDPDWHRPIELQEVKNKIIGYVGNINNIRINYPLLRDIAINHADKTLVIVGPLNSQDYKIHGLDKFRNIIFTGGKNITEVPHYLRYFDVAIIPFLLDDLTAGIYPLKVNEYLYAGKPVVSTAFSDDIKQFSDIVYLANDDREFSNLIEVAISSDDDVKRTERRKVALSNTWEARVFEFWKIINLKI